MLKKTKALLKKKQDNGNSILKDLIEQCEAIKANGNKRMPCNELIGKLRVIFAQISLDKLEPDLVIMDEFQRFKYTIIADKAIANHLHAKPESEVEVFNACNSNNLITCIDKVIYKM